MPTHSNVKTCAHIKVTGVRCGSPALRGEQFCYFHQRMINTVKGPQMRLHHIALLESPEAIQASVMEVMNALIRGTIELKRGELILRALNTAVRNSRRVQFDRAHEMVTTIPNYPAPPKTPDPSAEKPFDMQAFKQAHLDEFYKSAAQTKAANVNQAEAKAAETKKAETKKAETKKAEEKKVETNTPDVKTASVAAVPDSVEKKAAAVPDRVGTDAFVRPGDRVGTAAPGCPGGPESPGRSNPSTKKTAAVTTTAIDPTKRKPPLSVLEAAPKERKTKAHRASGG